MRKFLLCKTCGNLLEIIRDSGVTPLCCGTDMTELTANTTDAASEKHVPVIKVERNMVTVKIGEVPPSYDRRTLHTLDLFKNK